MATMTPISGIRRLHNGIGCKRRGHKNKAAVGAGFSHCCPDRIKHGDIVHFLAGFTRGYPGNHPGTIIDTLTGVKLPSLPVMPCTDHSCIFVYEDTHFFASQLVKNRIFTAEAQKTSLLLCC